MNIYKLYARLCVSFCLSVGVWVCVWQIKFQSKPLQNPTDFCDRPNFQTLSSFQFAYYTYQLSIFPAALAVVLLQILIC